MAIKQLELSTGIVRDSKFLNKRILMLRGHIVQYKEIIREFENDKTYSRRMMVKNAENDLAKAVKELKDLEKELKLVNR